MLHQIYIMKHHKKLLSILTVLVLLIIIACAYGLSKQNDNEAGNNLSCTVTAGEGQTHEVDPSICE